MTVKNKVPEDIFIPEIDLALGKEWCNNLYTLDNLADLNAVKFWKFYLRSLALSCFKWEGVPAGIDTRAIEYILLYFGIGAIFEESGGFMFAQAVQSDQLNMYYNPNKVILTTPNNNQYIRHSQAWIDNSSGGIVKNADCALCFDNLDRTPIIPFINHYARRLARTDTLIDMNIDAQSQPWLIAGEEEAKGNINRIIQKLKKKDRFIKINSRGFSGDSIQVLNTQSPYVSDKLTDTQKTIIDTFLTAIGCDNSNTDKKERVNVQETLSNNEQIMLLRNSRLKCRKDFAKKANELFGLDISVSWSVPHQAETAESLSDGVGYDEEEVF